MLRNAAWVTWLTLNVSYGLLDLLYLGDVPKCPFNAHIPYNSRLSACDVTLDSSGSFKIECALLKEIKITLLPHKRLKYSEL